MKTRYLIFIIIAILVVIALYFLPGPISPIQQLVISTFREPVLDEFENLEEIKLLKEKYNVTRTGENFNSFQNHFANFYFVEPNGILKPPFVNIVVIKDLSSGEIHMVGGCTPESSSGYRLEQRQILPYLKEHDCLKDSLLTQETIDKKFPPFSVFHRGEEFDGKTVDIIIPKGISSDEKYDLDPSIVVSVIGKNNTIRWINQDDVPHTLYSNEPCWTTGVIEPGKSAVLTFTEQRVFEYHGSPGPWINGKVVVLENEN